MSTDNRVAEAWLKMANSNPMARAMAAGAEPFLVQHDIPHNVFAAAARRGDYVSTVFDALEQVGRTVRGDQLGGRIDDVHIVKFWQDEIKLAAQPRKSAQVAHD